MTDKETLANTVNAINRVWKGSDSEVIGAELRRFFADDMVIVGPDLRVLARGAEACARSYAEFISNASIEKYDSGELSIEIFGDVAIVVHPWSMTFSIFGKQSTESGREVITFARISGTWRAVWRAMLPQ